MKNKCPARYSNKNLFKVSAGAYLQSAFGSGCIEEGNLPLVNEQECREAAISLNKNFKFTVNDAEYPSGCYFYANGQTYWNLHTTGKKRSDRAEICTKSGRNNHYFSNCYEEILCSIQIYKGIIS